MSVKCEVNFKELQTVMATTPPKKKHRRSQSTPCLYTLRVDLVGAEPPIWRQIVVDGRCRLAALHHVLQAAMGWSDAHLHKFEIRKQHYGVPDPEYDDTDWKLLDEKKFRLNQLLDVGDTCLYLYDFGDSWEHSLRVESINDDVDPHRAGGIVWIEAGERACPPDDAGGISGYQEMFATLENAPYGEEALRLQTWAGLDFDPERFDRRAANIAIHRMQWNGWIKIGP
jgi:hypothetical protein